ncbi:unnamed protein product [Kuraishia capsulata CBS 1993]|uniref:Uncharacterized protein n=1 Tax=Kuraishia capsulata CBS 1993 TaxID=1382522 RepID=W6MY55_9ASCO|nr:uncharacterized protein KUCA_T00006040001 [Kuraishia capsulata CBS 1993]CDK30045.1 unnamed protein product [Kuraishia capsulata CBS 1993]
MSLETLLTTILESVKTTTESLKNLEETLESGSANPVEGTANKEGISLLALKNSSMLSYVNSVVLFALAKLDALESKEGVDIDQIDAIVKKTVEQRVVLERGVKPLEKKLGYQMDKLTRSFLRMQKDLKEAESKTVDESADGSGSDDSEDEEDAFNYRPNAANFAQPKAGEVKRHDHNDQDDAEGETETESTEKYKPPRISAMVPPTEEKPRRNRQKLQSMEEYLEEIGDTPMLESSIGSTILDHGRGVKTSKDVEKEREITRYEEENFTRLPENVTKKQKRKKDTFAGEDWSMFGNDKEGERFKSKKVKNTWEKAKRRRM